MSKLPSISSLKPENLFAFFADICSVPHPSGHTGKIADYLVGFAKARKLDFYRDKADNVIIRKPATKGYEKAEPVILQGHIDMVSASRIRFDFEKESVLSHVRIDGDLIKTDGTTLGGDDGMGAAIMLAVLDDRTLKHPELEALFTSDEETGMIGASALNVSKLKGRRMINLDTENEDEIVCGCAGGVTLKGYVPVKRNQVKGKKLTIKISGLAGGHSGLEIHKGRANANILMARLLYILKGCLSYGLSELKGGTKDNAIPPVSEAGIVVDEKDIDTAKKEIRKIAALFSNEYKSVECNLKVSVRESDVFDEKVLQKGNLEKILDVLLALPDGVFSMSPDIEGFVQTSNNIGIIGLSEKSFFFSSGIRSSVQSQLDLLCSKIRCVAELAGGKVLSEGGYSAWSFNPDSRLLKSVAAVYERKMKKKPDLKAVHAGLECGVFFRKMKNLDAVSFGPDITGAHTPDESLSISSSVRIYELVKEILSRLK